MREGEQLGAQRAHADDLGRDVPVADRHPGAPHPPAHQVLGDEREEGDDDPARSGSAPARVASGPVTMTPSMRRGGAVMVPDEA